jgi:hypothetical protein
MLAVRRLKRARRGVNIEAVGFQNAQQGTHSRDDLAVMRRCRPANEVGDFFCDGGIGNHRQHFSL